MKNLLAVILILTASITAAGAQQSLTSFADAENWLEEHADIQRMVMVPMRDGVRLQSRIYTPKEGSGKYPTIFIRTPYSFSDYGRDPDGRIPGNIANAIQAIEHGYAVVIQNERGKYFSEGDWRILGYPRTDGYDALDWISSQTWSDGGVATMGCSSSAEWHMALASTNHPAFKAAITQGYGAGIGHMGEYAEHGAWHGGAMINIFASWMYGEQNLQRPQFSGDLSQEDLIRLSTYTDLRLRKPPVDWDKAYRHLPQSEMMEKFNGPKGPYNDYIAQGPGGDVWKNSGLFHEGEDYHTPTLWFASWYDISVAPNMEIFNYVREKASKPEIRDAQYAIVAPVRHCGFGRITNPLVVGTRDLGDARFDLEKSIYDFLDHYMKDEDNGFKEDTPRVRYYAMGENEWRTADQWPPAEATTKTFYLDSENGANSRNGDGVLTEAMPDGGSDSFIYDPANPVPTPGPGALYPSSYDNAEIELRGDVLVYSTPTLTEPLDVTGKMRIKLFLSTDVKDTDLTVKLVDVYPDGRAMTVDNTIQRVRYREGYDKQVFMEPGEVYEVNVSSIVTSNVFLPGHKMRIEISSSNFPRYDRNLNMGTNNFFESDMRITNNVIHHSPEHASRLIVEVIE